MKRLLLPKKVEAICYVRLLLICLLVFSGSDASAQLNLSAYSELGKHNASDGIFVRATGMANYNYAEYYLQMGLQTDILSYNERIVSGYFVNAGKELVIKEIPFDLRILFNWIPAYDVLRETNFGLIASKNHHRFLFSLGTNFRTLAYTTTAAKDYDIDIQNKIHENWNLMYNLSYYIKEFDNYWNVGISLTNFDHFIINQETNPIFNIKGIVNLNPTVKLFGEAWYKSAGAFNLRVNYFGFFIRSGVIWNIH